MKLLIAGKIRPVFFILSVFVLVWPLPVFCGTFVFSPFQDALVAGGGVWDDVPLGLTQSAYLLQNPPLLDPAPPYPAYGLLQFDLSPLPATFLVRSAALQVAHLGNLAPFGSTMSLFGNTTQWDEHSVTYQTRPDFTADQFSESVLIGDGLTRIYRIFDITRMTQRWIDGSAANHGMSFRQEPRQEYIRIPSKEFPGPEFVPVLIIEGEEIDLTVPEPAGFALGAVGFIAAAGFRWVSKARRPQS